MIRTRFSNHSSTKSHRSIKNSSMCTIVVVTRSPWNWSVAATEQPQGLSKAAVELPQSRCWVTAESPRRRSWVVPESRRSLPGVITEMPGNHHVFATELPWYRHGVVMESSWSHGDPQCHGHRAVLLEKSQGMVRARYRYGRSMIRVQSVHGLTTAKSRSERLAVSSAWRAVSLTDECIYRIWWPRIDLYLLWPHNLVKNCTK